MSTEFILVTGANGTGKTMLIESNRHLLEKEGFRIIIPDNILRHATSLTDSPALIQEHIDDAISGRGNFYWKARFSLKAWRRRLPRLEKLTLVCLYTNCL